MKMRLKSFLSALHRDESGAMSVEKILILAAIALPILVVLYLFRNIIQGWFKEQSDSLKDSQTQGPVPSQ